MLRRSRYGVDGLVRLGAISHGSAVWVRCGRARSVGAGFGPVGSGGRGKAGRAR